MNKIRSYKGDITFLPNNGIFVFGSNTQGRHGKGGALTARNKFGAIYGQSHGLQGKSYAIITKNLNLKKHPSVSKIDIQDQIIILYEFAKNNPDKLFFVNYKDSPNLNSYTPKEMANMFQIIDIPDNMIFEESFTKLFYIID